MSDPGVKGSRILFVDDEEAIRRLFETYLSNEGFYVRGAATLAEALDELENATPEVVVVDKNLPDGSGLQVLHACRDAYPDIEVIVLTGYPSLESAIDALRLGAFDYIIKPVLDLDLVSQKLHRALERRSMRLESRQRSQELSDALDFVLRSLESASKALSEGHQDDLRALLEDATRATRKARSSQAQLQDGDPK